MFKIQNLFKSRDRRVSLRRSMQVEGLETRALLTIGSPTFLNVGGTMYLQFDGTANRDAFLLAQTATGDVQYQAWEDAEGDGFDPWNLEQEGTVSAGEIANARLQLGNIPYGGVRVLAGGDNDIVDGYVTSSPYVSPNGSVAIPSSLAMTTNTANYPIWADGGAGNDQLQGGRKGDRFDGGAGNDQVWADRFDNPDSIRGGVGNDTLFDSAAGTPGGVGVRVNNVDFETITLDNGAKDRVDNTGFSDPSTAVAGVVTVRVSTFGGDDYIISGPNTFGTTTLREILDGGAGTDTISYETHTTSVEVNLALQTVSGANDTISNFENATGGSANDVLIGSGVANVLIGGDGDDSLDGRGGNDSMFGGNGDDNMVGGAGDDVMEGNNGADILDGSGGNDRLVGGSDGSFDQVNGQAGNDTIVIPWAYLAPYNASPPPTPAPIGAYNGGLGIDTFEIVGVPAALSAADFANAFDNFILWLQFNGLTDWGYPDLVTRINA